MSSINEEGMPREPVVAIIGCGLVGQSWAIAFARGGCTVTLFDALEGTADRALSEIEPVVRNLHEADLLGGRTVAEVRGNIKVAASLDAALSGADHVQENAPERLEVKRDIFRELDRLAPPEAVIASSTSALLPSHFTSALPGAARCLVAHPLNPPHLIPAVEIVPAPTTAPDALARTVNLMTAIGQRPIVLHREIEGFLMNRLQGALLDEAFLLVSEGYIDVDAVDAAIKDGLALRWSFMGPFETIDLNAPAGIVDFMTRYGKAYAEIGRDRPGRVGWSADLARRIEAQRRAVLPANRLTSRQSWRDRRLTALLAHKRWAATAIDD